MATLDRVRVTTDWTLVHDADADGEFAGTVSVVGADGVAIRTAGSMPVSDVSATLLMPRERLVVRLSGSEKLYAKAYTDTSVIVRDNGLGVEIPPGVFTGDRAMTMQNYNEANSKRGLNYEFSALLSALALNTPQFIGFTTSDQPVVVKSRSVLGGFVQADYEVFTGSAFTGGTSIPIFSNNDVTVIPAQSAAVLSPTVTDVGSPFGPVTHLLGTEGLGNHAVANFGAEGAEKILKPNTKYLIRTTNLAATAILALSIRIGFYEGPLDLPRP